MADGLRIVFVCQHGAAKSVIAAAYCRRLAASRGLGVDASSCGPEPDAEMLPEAVAGLRAEGVEPAGGRPQRLTHAQLATASHIVSFGCELADLAPPGAAIERWDDCPPASEDYAAARDYILTRLAALIERL